MARRDPRIDAYIEHSAEFAKPILTHIRKLVHKACPGVEETLKWSFPHFDYKGAMMCSMASFKAHCAFNFWKGSILPDPDGILNKAEEKAMGQMGRLVSVKDLPPDAVMIRYIKAAMRLNDEGVPLPSRSGPAAKPVETPKELLAALKTNPAAKKTYDAFSPSHRKEYEQWITGAKTEATRRKRIATAVEWMAEGLAQNWRYMKKKEL
jgi:uncharacterized protein YdeI (YjbR/CyaY-like superfamily)